MSNASPEILDDALLQRSLKRWDNEGGAGPHDPDMALPSAGGTPDMGQAELIALHIRVIALENLVILLLADGPDGERARARAMAAYIAPRSGHTAHPLTTHAAAHMTDAVDRALRFSRDDQPEVG